MTITGYIDQRYDSTFESVYEALTEMARRDPDAARQKIRQTLKSLYVWQGNDWTGRGAVCDASINASIAAHEAILADLAYCHSKKKESP